MWFRLNRLQSALHAGGPACRHFYFVFGMMLFGILNCRANESSEITGAFRGEVIQWSVPATGASPSTYHLEPAGHGLLHVQPHRQLIKMTLVANQTGPVLVRDHQSKVIRQFNIKPWPDRPPSGGVTAGSGELSGKWLSIEDQSRAGESVSLILSVEGEASLAIVEPPKINVQSDTTPQLAPFIRSETGWPEPDKKPYRIWHYEWTNTQAGLYRVNPLLFHYLDLKTGQIQTKLVPGPSWTTAPRELFQAPAQPTQADRPTRHRGAIILFIYIICNALATIIVIFRHALILSFVNFRLKQTDAPLSQEVALTLYRRYEPIIADIERARPKTKPASLTRVRDQLRAVEKVAFGRPADQKPIR